MWTRVVFKELLQRKWGFVFSVLAVGIAAASLALILAIHASLDNEARIITRDMGQNIEIMPQDVPADQYWRGQFGESTMPEQIVEALVDPNVVALVDRDKPIEERVSLVSKAEADQRLKGPGARSLTPYPLPDLADHYVAELQGNIAARSSSGEMQVILTGQRQEEGRKKHSPITVPPLAGQARLGSAVAEQLGVKLNGKVEIGGQSFTVISIEADKGSSDDIRVYTSLADAQKLLGKPGRINRIVALGCLCEQLTIGQVADVLERRVDQYNESHQLTVPAKAVPMTRIAAAREQLRNLIGDIAVVLGPVLGVICAALVCGYFYFNIRERQQEIGVMLAIGYRPAPIVLAVLVKLALVSVLGGLVGTVGGILLAQGLAPSLLIRKVIAPWYLTPMTMAVAIGLTLLAGIYPLILAGRTEAAAILRNA